MRKRYYNPMRNPATIVPSLAIALCSAVAANAQQQSTMRAAAVESHEGVTISAQPWTDATPYKEKFPKKSPLSYGVVAIDTVIRNDSEESMKVDLDQIRLNVTVSEDNTQALRSLTPDDVADACAGNGGKDPTSSRRAPFPIPSKGPKVGRDKHWVEMQKAAEEAAIPGSIVPPHHSVHGLLYFDLQSQFDLLDTAHLYIPDVRALEKNRSLLYFEIDLSRH
ncbi:MAG TPA: hypothetical protein VE077_05830 [Candidatus Methylomirabilis sp.]|nr:hypothetical protein [Candidatus Methylomirabilis sp.]